MADKERIAHDDELMAEKDIERVSLAKHPLEWIKGFFECIKMSWHCDRKLATVYLKPNGTMVFKEGSVICECLDRAIAKKQDESRTDDDLK